MSALKWVRDNWDRIVGVGQLVAAAVVIAAVIYTYWPRAGLPVNESSPLPPAKEVIHTEKIITQVKYINVYPDKVKEKLDLPAPVKDDVHKQVTATGKLDAEDRPYTLSAVIDLETGDSQVYARPDPLPWLAPGKRNEIGIAYGLKNGVPQAGLFARKELLRVKAIHGGAMALLWQDADWFTGVYAALEFN